jgi:predicted nucleic acid-binding protein
LIIISGELVNPKAMKHCISRDKDDDKFIIAAMEAKCKLVISGDKDLLILNEYLGIKINKPADFIKQYLNSNKGM